MVRVNTGSLYFLQPDGYRFDLRTTVSGLGRPGSVASWDVATGSNRSADSVDGRVCMIRKSDAAIEIALRALHKKASKKGKTPKPQTLEFAKYVIVFTTFPTAEFSPEAILDWYRLRWQVELVFKRFKSVAQLGHLPKHGQRVRKGLALWQAVRSPADRKTDCSCQRRFPLGYDLLSPRTHPEQVA